MSEKYCGICEYYNYYKDECGEDFFVDDWCDLLKEIPQDFGETCIFFKEER